MEQISLLDRLRQQVLAGGDDRQQTTRAREAAEALFAPKRPMPKALAIKSPSPAEASARKPRVLSISPSPLPDEKVEPAIPPAPPVTPAISKSEVARIRTWLKYGMTIAQAAAVYGVAVDEVERVLRRA